jgi:hypothetical protein
MSAWLWLIVGVAAFLAISVLVGLAIAAVLGHISREVSELLDSGPWTSAPLLGSQDAPERVAPAEQIDSAEEVFAGRLVGESRR